MITIADLVLHYSHFTALICCFIFNITLCICLYTEKRYQLKVYAKVLYVQCCSDMVAGVLYYISAVRFMLIDGIFYFVHINPILEPDYVKILDFDVPTNCIEIYVYLFASGLPITFLPLNFYFRYLQLCQ